LLSQDSRDLFVTKKVVCNPLIILQIKKKAEEVESEKAKVAELADGNDTEY
jgi:hypothetical protein